MRIEHKNQEIIGAIVEATVVHQSLDKPSSAGKHLPFLDVLRGVAILSVFMHHALGAAAGYYSQPWKGYFPDFFAAKTSWILFPLTLGNCGVAIFFVVSGFCIHLSHVRGKGETWFSFAVKRFFRIYPPYLLALLVFYLSWPWRTYSLSSPGWNHQFWSHFYLLHNFDQLTLYGINGSFWSIAVEAQLYLIYPLLLCLISVCGWRVSLVFLFIIESAIRLSVFHGISPLQSLEFSPFGFWFSWTLGSFLADCYLRNKLGRCRSWLVWLSPFLAISAYCFYPLAKFQFMTTSLFTTILIWRLIVSPISLPRRHHLLNSSLKHLAFLGTVSFSFYLIHQPLLQLVQRINPRLQNLVHGPVLPLAICLALYPLILMLSSFMCRYVEQPFSAAGKSLAKPKRLA